MKMNWERDGEDRENMKAAKRDGEIGTEEEEEEKEEEEKEEEKEEEAYSTIQFL